MVRHMGGIASGNGPNVASFQAIPPRGMVDPWESQALEVHAGVTGDEEGQP
jgi:hypothetical protein